MNYLDNKFVADVENAIEELRVRDWQEWERWGQVYWLNIFRENKMLAVENMSRLGAELGSRVMVGSAFGAAFLQQCLEAKVQIIWRSARRKMPTLTVDEMLDRLTTKDIDRLIDRFELVHKPAVEPAQGNAESQSP